MFLHSSILSKQVDSYYQYLFSEGVSLSNKIKILSWLCNDLYGIYYLDSTYLSSLYVIQCKITNSDLSLSDRLKFLQYKNEGFVISVCKLLYKSLSITSNKDCYIQVIKYLLKSQDDCKLKIIQDLINLFPTLDRHSKMEIIDILLTSGYKKEGELLLTILKPRQRVGNVPIRTDIRTIYTDTQNVHTTDINKNVLRISVYLIEHYFEHELDMYIIRTKLISIVPIKEQIINRVMERIIVDATEFSYTKEVVDTSLTITFRLYDVFKSLWKFIHNHKYKDELIKRLIEEIVEMEKYCSTGHLSRLINVIQGYDMDDNLTIKISDKEGLKNVLYTYLNKELENSDEEIIDSMMSTEREPFLKFVEDKVNIKMKEIEYNTSSFVPDLLELIKKYTLEDKWKIENNILKRIVL